ncbi:organoarsenical effux MFS transporter ArsJ [Shewanella sp. KX20019]|uniref:organoarsenical effux MFS transporter ArsJ n=1 Tax=Shewanella sp. KX20019 TaxID=2803864 RepID=UPI001927DA06|nr:organoarsenical effux MFS transporter ArsJ [Shewanella sp. KX20019]QQX79693.1 organoarsenical effux MFS transporter ArsJ [Shewanella sp. KX20019]
MLAKYRALPESIRQYLLVTGNYWAFTLTDGALRMLVVLHFYDLGYTPLAIAMLFLFYEIFGVMTNLVGGWLGARLGLNRTMNIGLGLQIVALSMLLLPSAMLTVPWVMAAQALSGIAKDLNKMSAKSAIKTLVPKDAEDKLYRWVAMLTGSKNALKGAGFFLGGLLLTLVGFTGAVAIMAALLFIVWLCSVLNLKADLGRAKSKPKFTEIFSKSSRVNILSAARLFLFAARDVWFVIALPVFLASQLGWDHSSVGSFLALWVIGYGVVQSAAPLLTRGRSEKTPDGATATRWAGLLTLVTAILTAVMFTGWIEPQLALLTGLMLFGAVFAINSSLHSYLIVSYAGDDGVSLDIGFYYMANAMGRLVGTLLSGWVYQVAGLGACLAVSTLFLLLTYLTSFKLPRVNSTL